MLYLAAGGLLASGSATAEAGGTLRASDPTIAVTATDNACAPSQALAMAGKITFSFTNRGHKAHGFSIAHTSTVAVDHGKTTRLTVTLGKPGAYPFACTTPRQPAAGKGVLRVTAQPSAAPVAGAANTSVTVTMGEYYFHLSQTSAPVGTVTFTLVNEGRFFHDMYFDYPLNKLSLETPPTQTTTFKVTFQKPGSYPFEAISGEDPENNMSGTFTVTG
jgi:plastocyanin